MKNRILLSFLTAGVLLSGCSKNESGDPSDGGRAAIRLGSGVAMVSKAPVTSGTQFTAGIAGWENTATETYDAAALWNTTIQTTANATEGQAVTWKEEQKYYNADEGTTTYMKAWHPAGTLSGTTVTFENTDGEVDALLAPVVSGTKADKDNAKTLAFEHMTAQINFKVQAGAGLADNTTLSSITIKDAQLPKGFDLKKTGADAVIYGEAADLTVPLKTNDLVIGTTAEEDDASDPVMIKPITGNTFTIDVVTSNATYTGQTVTVTGENVAAGTAYDVTLTFGQGGITLKATVTDWKKETGSADIE